MQIRITRDTMITETENSGGLQELQLLQTEQVGLAPTHELGSHRRCSVYSPRRPDVKVKMLT